VQLAAELAKLWEAGPAASVVASGERSVAIGRDMVGGTVVTGDVDRVER